MIDRAPTLTELGPFGTYFAEAWPGIEECFTKHWGRNVVKARLVTGWSVLFRLEHESTWRLKTWCDSWQSHLWACTDGEIVREMGQAFTLGSASEALGRFRLSQREGEGRGGQQEPLRWVLESLEERGSAAAAA